MVIPSDTNATDLEVLAEDGRDPDLSDISDRPDRFVWTTSSRYDLERRSGYLVTDSTAFLGPPITFRSRLRAKLGRHAKVAIVVDHDAGEGTRPISRLFDFVSAAIEFAKLGVIRSVVIGAMRPRFGLGLSIWGGQRMTSLKNTGGSLLGSGSSITATGTASEIAVLRGLGVVIDVTSRFRISGFAGRTTTDAVVYEPGEASRLSTSGLHRNDNELSQDDRMIGRLSGGALSFESEFLTLGAAFAVAATNLNVVRGARPYQTYNFSGNTWNGGSLYGQIGRGRRLRISWEIALDNDRTPAGLFIFRLETMPGWSFYSSWRDYPARFNSVYGSPPGSTGSTSGNERGWVIGINGRSGNHHVQLYRDLYRKPWLQYDSYRPSIFDAWGVHVEGAHGALSYVIRYDRKVSNREYPGFEPSAAPFRHRSRLRIQFKTNDDYVLQPTLDLVLVRLRDGAASFGEAIGQRLVWLPDRRVLVTVGTVFFQSDSGNSGVYLYEPDLPGYFSVPLLSRGGQRTYAILNIRITKSIRCWIKGSITRFEQERTVGSGIDALTTSRLRSIAIAARISI